MTPSTAPHASSYGARTGTRVPASIAIRFGDDVDRVIQARMTYSLRVFAAVFGYEWREPADPGANVICLYGSTEWRSRNGSTLRIPVLYRKRGLTDTPPAQDAVQHGGEGIPLFHGTEMVDGERRPDWLGEIFEWLTASYELSAEDRDSVGRIPFDATAFARLKVSPRKPYATLLMAWLQQTIECAQTGEKNGLPLPAAPSCSPDADHLVVSSHDIDFYWSNRTSALLRTVKNVAIAQRLYRSRGYLRSNSRLTLNLLGGRRVGDFLPQLIYHGDHEDFRSTLFVVAKQGHRRDPSYRLEDLEPRLVEARDAGFEIALHSSYCSVVEESDFTSEKAALSKVTADSVRGIRQHWLRFDHHRKLFGAVANAGFLYDSTLGFATAVGFRNGASFAFPPYCLETESPYSFLEIPLVLMDGAIEATARETGEDARDVSLEVLNASRRYGWGGVAALWHNPIEPLSVPQEINDVFWSCIREKEQHREKWISGSEFLERSLPRYQAAGFMNGAIPHA